jgi:hypothetical protein
LAAAMFDFRKSCRFTHFTSSAGRQGAENTITVVEIRQTNI